MTKKEQSNLEYIIKNRHCRGIQCKQCPMDMECFSISLPPELIKSAKLKLNLHNNLKAFVELTHDKETY